MENKKERLMSAEEFFNTKNFGTDFDFAQDYANYVTQWQQQQNKNLYIILDENYDLNIQFHQAIRESIFSFAVSVYDEKLTFEEWTKKHYGKHIEVSKNLYSEEDMNEYAEYCTKHVLTTQIGHPYQSPKKWFNQNKKK